ncbi:hypothetical protein RchiOBHm_Chr2g0094771 [Rosa chinensis]|uniref:Uncharacterized protein n=1 Tax=Rosa chinensis TaxID=74649 RepID=A0A2P6RKN7_ROSCH|nr:hypothetical protein RchiOBHm_Chr2g0094771 [Rosa chinensis]
MSVLYTLKVSACSADQFLTYCFLGFDFIRWSNILTRLSAHEPIAHVASIAQLVANAVRQAVVIYTLPTYLVDDRLILALGPAPTNVGTSGGNQNENLSLPHWHDMVEGEHVVESSSCVKENVRLSYRFTSKTNWQWMTWFKLL